MLYMLYKKVKLKSVSEPRGATVLNDPGKAKHMLQQSILAAFFE